mmetsp:Transcript_8/g.32  ORF Transcript_8/g.32 Transcript_8/m.32 type:complete len:214 (+) Transcript_8:99-740(+)
MAEAPPIQPAEFVPLLDVQPAELVDGREGQGNTQQTGAGREPAPIHHTWHGWDEDAGSQQPIQVSYFNAAHHSKAKTQSLKCRMNFQFTDLATENHICHTRRMCTQASRRCHEIVRRRAQIESERRLLGASINNVIQCHIEEARRQRMKLQEEHAQVSVDIQELQRERLRMVEALSSLKMRIDVAQRCAESSKANSCLHKSTGRSVCLAAPFV